MSRLVCFDIAGTLVDGNPWMGLFKSAEIPRWRVWLMYPLIMPPVLLMRAGLLPDTRFRQIWIRQVALMLRGINQERLSRVFAWIAEDFTREMYREPVLARLRGHIEAGDTVILISGMFTEMTQAFANHLGADDGIGTQLGFDADNKCIGRIVSPGCAGEEKVNALLRYLTAHGLTAEQGATYAYADSYSDVPLLSWSDTATATYPDEELTNIARERGWAVIAD